MRAVKFAALWESSNSPPDVFAFLNQNSDFIASEKLAVLLLDQQRRWKTSHPFTVEDYLNKLPDLASDPQNKLQLAVGEFQARQDSRISPSIDEFVTRFPDIGDTLRGKLSELAAVNSTVDMSMGAELTGTDAAKIGVHPEQPQDTTNTYRPDPALGDQRLGRYRLVRLLGEGAFGRVWLGQDSELHRYVAIKVPKPERFQRPEDAEDYLSEARTVSSLDHPHIVPVYDVGRTDDGSMYVVSKFIEGRTLGDRIKKDRPNPEESAKLLATIAEALHHAHLKRLIHRDVKPANILLEDSTGNSYLADFGLAIREEDYLRDGRIAGTPAFMSPEQARGEGHRLDGRSDVFSLGVVFYELLTGKRPFRATTTREVLQQVVSLEPVPPCQVIGSIPPELERICLKALSKRASDRYATASEFADDLLHWNQTPQQEHKELRIVPKGLRSFDANDADFFLDLLPGPRNRDGLPESIQFWKTRIEETDPDKSFSVGLIYGPSGCGKSSLVKAGLLPRLSKKVIPVYVEATPDDTEKRILSGLRKQVSGLPKDLGLVETFIWLRRHEGRKVLVVLDQFEQWLHSHRAEQQTELVTALRQCDGGKLQAVVMVRDDFAMAAARFMESLDIPIVQGHNFATVDLFDVDHARKVLLKFGQAFGKLSSNLSDKEREFVSSVANGLATDNKVVSVRLALFAEMVKGKPWVPTTLDEVGGTEGIGVNFLEETFVSRSANPRHRLHQTAARNVLKALLPEAGTDIKGHMQSRADLLEVSGYGSRPKDFDDLLRILDSEIRLITPTDPEDGTDRECYQLTHDYLVPSLRDWLTRKQKETRQGRAELLLADRAGVWNTRPENRQLPSLLQWIQIRWWTKKKNWKPLQKKMMGRAGSLHLSRGAVIAVVITLLSIVSSDGFGRLKSQMLRERLMESTTAEVPGIVKEMVPYRRWVNPLIVAAYRDAEAQHDARKQLHASLALLPVDDSQVGYLYGRLLNAEPQELVVIRQSLLGYKEDLSERLWTMLLNSQHEKNERFRAACALAAYTPDDPRWNKAGPEVAAMLVIQKPFVIGQWTDTLKGAGRWLILPLVDFLSQEKRSLLEKGLIVTVYDTFAAVVPDAYSRLERQLNEKIEPDAAVEAKIALAKRQASIGAALLVMGRTNMFWLLLKHQPDPTLRSFLIQRLGPVGADASVLIARLDQEHDVSAKRAILLALGGYGPDLLSRDQLLPRLLELYRDDPDPGLHGASEWLMRQWGQVDKFQTIDNELATGKLDCQRQWSINRQGQTMVVIPKPGEFWMGGEREGRHRRQIGRSFAIATKEVTTEQFLRFRKDHGYNKDYASTLACPVNNVSWYDAVAYCNWLSMQEEIAEDHWCYLPNAAGEYNAGMTMAPDYLQRAGYRLPTEAEWEYACRAGAETGWSFGEATEVLDQYAWYGVNSLTKSHPVGLLKPNDLGLSDLHGNVWEWTQDLYKPYPKDKAVTDDSQHKLSIDEKGVRVMRGGSFLYHPEGNRSAFRNPNIQSYRSNSIGFRVARTLPSVPHDSLPLPAEGGEIETTDK